MGQGDGDSAFTASLDGPCSLDRETKGSRGLGRDRLHAARVEQHGTWPLTVDVRIDNELAILERMVGVASTRKPYRSNTAFASGVAKKERYFAASNFASLVIATG